MSPPDGAAACLASASIPMHLVVIRLPRAQTHAPPLLLSGWHIIYLTRLTCHGVGIKRRLTLSCHACHAQLDRAGLLGDMRSPSHSAHDTTDIQVISRRLSNKLGACRVILRMGPPGSTGRRVMNAQVVRPTRFFSEPTRSEKMQLGKISAAVSMILSAGVMAKNG